MSDAIGARQGRITNLEHAIVPRFLHMNPQQSSWLFNGRIPPEIRDRIFEYVLTEDEDIPYENNTHYTRPEYASHHGISCDLLRTCRRVYLEAHHYPMMNRSHTFWHHRGPLDSFKSEGEEQYFRRFRYDQRQYARKIHLYTQQFWLEGSLKRVCQLQCLEAIQKMKITLRRGDWWLWEYGNTLGINPQRGIADSRQMLRDWRAEELGEVIPWSEDAWGTSFKYLKNLKELEFEFETAEYEEKELQAIVDHAKKGWKFPMSDGKSLSAEGQVIVRKTWRGPTIVWNNRCSGGHIMSAYKVLDCKTCIERFDLKEKNLGPLLVVLSLRWKLIVSEAGH